MGDILVVEHDNLICALLTETLGEKGYIVRSARDRTGMHRALATQLPDLLICDVDLDRGPGLTLINDVRAACGAAVPLVLMTTSTWIAQSLARQGYMFCLLKPFHLNDLLTSVAMNIRSPGSIDSASLRERTVAA
jgi:two-component system nitrogen regulation response regulator GlnG